MRRYLHIAITMCISSIFIVKTGHIILSLSCADTSLLVIIWQVKYIGRRSKTKMDLSLKMYKDDVTVWKMLFPCFVFKTWRTTEVNFASTLYNFKLYFIQPLLKTHVLCIAHLEYVKNRNETSICWVC